MKTASVYSIPCSHCGAKAGKPCRNTFTGALRAEPHKTRFYTLERQKEKDQ